MLDSSHGFIDNYWYLFLDVFNIAYLSPYNIIPPCVHFFHNTRSIITERFPVVVVSITIARMTVVTAVIAAYTIGTNSTARFTPYFTSPVSCDA